MCVEARACVWRPGHVCGGHGMCVEATACVWRPEHVCGGHGMCVEATACVWKAEDISQELVLKFPSCLRQGLLFAAAQARLSGP